jgi:hypothetical protein
VQDVLEHVVNERAMAYGKGEHLKHKLTRYHGVRISFRANANFLIRVPLFERDWKMPMRRAVGANYFTRSSRHRRNSDRRQSAPDLPLMS